MIVLKILRYNLWVLTYKQIETSDQMISILQYMYRSKLAGVYKRSILITFDRLASDLRNRAPITFHDKKRSFHAVINKFITFCDKITD
jgi:hypothetical protein